MNKTIHVNSYTRRDVTQVKEHYRNITTFTDERTNQGAIEEFPLTNYEGMIVYTDEEPIILEGGVSTDVYLPGGDDIIIIDESGSEISSSTVAKTAIDTGFKAIQIADHLREVMYSNFNIGDAESLKYQLDIAVQNLKRTYFQSKKLSQKYLEKLTQTKDKAEYEILFKTFARQKEINTKAEHQIAKIEYYAENNDYDSVINELNNYRSNFDDVVKKNQVERPLYTEKQKNSISLNTPTPVPTPNFDLGNPNLYPIAQFGGRKFIDVSTTGLQLLNVINDAEKFWKASSYNFAQSKDYIEKNGNLIYSVSELPTKDLQQIVSNKLKQQIGKADTIGIIFKPNSSISNAISNSATIREYFNEHANQLLNGKVIETGSKRFNWNKNFDLFATYGNVDILYAHINQDGNFYAIVFDTYDFNKGENKLIDIARSVQNVNLAQKYYTLSIVIIPKEKWKYWL